MNDEQARRVALNESIFRQVNEQIESLHDLGAGDRTMSAICECARADCTESFEITLSEYENVRADPPRYVIVSGHALRDFDAVVESRDEYGVAEKRDCPPAAPAEE